MLVGASRVELASGVCVARGWDPHWKLCRPRVAAKIQVRVPRSSFTFAYQTRGSSGVSASRVSSYGYTKQILANRIVEELRISSVTLLRARND